MDCEVFLFRANRVHSRKGLNLRQEVIFWWHYCYGDVDRSTSAIRRLENQTSGPWLSALVHGSPQRVSDILQGKVLNQVLRFYLCKLIHCWYLLKPPLRLVVF